MAVRLCKICGDFHDLNEAWPVECFTKAHISGIQIIRDIDPYKAVATDIATGARPVIGSRREHREFLKRNGYHERGSDSIKAKRPEYADVSPRELKQTIDRIIGRKP